LGRLTSWWSRLAGTGATASRWIVVDTETTGLDTASDALLAIGGVALDETGVRPGDSFEVVLQNTRASDRHNIALHGIGREAQRSGVPVAQALEAFVAWSEQAPRFAFHADFDRAVLERAAREAGVALPSAPWIDVAPLASALSPRAGHGDRRTTLDEWLAVHGIACDTRHNAASDALATAELLLRLRAAAARQGGASAEALARVARQAKWLGAR
jgi:DNA polymerase-3 subunit epsilon